MNRCPPPLRLERAFVEYDRDVERHIQSCATCRTARDDHEALQAALTALPYPPMSDQASDAMRVGLVAAARATKQRHRVGWAPWAAGLAAAAALAFFVSTLPKAPSAEAPPAETVATAPPVERSAPPQITTVDLQDGAPVFEVPTLDMSSIVLRTVDVSVEADRARFRAVAKDGVLERLEILSGRVTVRPKTGDPIVLEAGRVWTTQRRAPPPARPAVAKRTPPPPVEPSAAPPPPTEAPPVESRSAFSQGWSAFRRGDYAEAVTQFDRVASGEGAFAEDAAFWCAIAELRRGEKDKAAARLDTFLKRHPDSTRADEAVRLLSRLRRR